MIIAGIDEAGYGPLLGPLVVSAAALELADVELPLETHDVPDVWRLLRAAVARKAPAKKGRLLIADSKLVHNLSDGVKLLERGVLAFLRAWIEDAALDQKLLGLSTTALLELLACTNHELADHPWYTPQEIKVPWIADPGDLAISCNMLTAALAAAKIKMVSMRTAVVSERAFNRIVGDTRNKASALISVTLSHLYHLHQNFGDRGLLVGVDKQGGRDHYTSLLLQSFPDAQLKVLLESAKCSIYLLNENSTGNGGGQKRTMIYFQEKGEAAFFPTALASMMCKYLRELCMHSFNTWWCQKIAGLRPTAGYYLDGSRWLIDVEPHLTRLGVQREMLVRIR